MSLKKQNFFLIWLGIATQITAAILTISMFIIGMIGCIKPNVLTTGSVAGDISCIVLGVLLTGINALLTLLWGKTKRR